ncbi:MAG TPA: maltose alpha-D-glucosyltransferase [Thermoanaerobaculia bacterium]|nr:maltose alpha-D-glucosyltransferase [Thermoanaerobaculia bacterium]
MKEAWGNDPLWFKDAVIYQLHVRSFADSNSDGIGDFRGLRRRLDYLEELGVTALWLLPFYPSPLRDEGYDIADYRNVNPAYGTLRDFRSLLRAAHDRGMRVITELVINHTSDQHPWFQKARNSPPGSAARDFYVWSDTPERYPDARIIFKDFERSNWTWDPVAGAYYWHRFYHHQPDLNFESKEVRRGVLDALDFWLEMGVDGVRLDAIPYLYEREGTNCENLPETHRFLKELRAHVDRRFEGRMLLAEANQWPEDAAAYFGDGDECHMNFHFPVMPRLFMALRMEDRFPIVDILQQTPEIPESCQWAMFLRNHDELTLEMVTDEDRDYMYRVYAEDPQARINLGIRRRLAPLLGNDRRRIELMNALLFSLPGTPIIYYGDEIGMGDNIYLGDRNGVRTPMQWSPGRNAGFSDVNPQKLYLPTIIDPEYHYETVNVEARQSNRHSLLWWIRRLIALRQRTAVFGRGTLELLHPDNHHVVAFVRRHQENAVLVICNLSRFAQHVTLEVRGYEGAVPIEMFGRTPFPPLEGGRLEITLGPHGFFWFELERGRIEESEAAEELPDLGALRRLSALARGRARESMAVAIGRILPQQRWFASKARTVREMNVRDVVPLDRSGPLFVVVEVEYTDAEAERYVLFVDVARARDDEATLPPSSRAVAYARLRLEGEPFVLVDALSLPGPSREVLNFIERRRRRTGDLGVLSGQPARKLADAFAEAETLEPRLAGVEQSNTTVLFGRTAVLKLFRRLQPGVNPDLEVVRFLTEKTDFAHIPQYLGAIELKDEDNGGEPATVALLQEFVESEANAWEYTLSAVGSFLERVMARGAPPATRTGQRTLLEAAARPIAIEARETIGAFLETARRLGEVTADMHLALASRRDVPVFAPEGFGAMEQRSLYQSLRATLGRTMALLDRSIDTLPEDLVPEAESLVGRRDHAMALFSRVLEDRDLGKRVRVHGDYHLGQLLFTGTDFYVLDFEGEPARPLTERRLKRSPLRDVAGMLRSFDYAVEAAERQLIERGVATEEHREDLRAWCRLWVESCSAAFLSAYEERTADRGILPSTRERRDVLLQSLLLEKAFYELGYELNNRPDWVAIPLRGLAQLLKRAEQRG